MIYEIIKIFIVSFTKKEINDLNKINIDTIFLSSKDKAIKVIKFTDNFSRINIIKT